MAFDHQTITFTEQSENALPWSYRAEAVFLNEEDAGQGSHAPYPLVAMLSIRPYGADIPLDVFVGGIDKIDALIGALNITRQRILVGHAEQELNMRKYYLRQIEAENS